MPYFLLNTIKHKGHKKQQGENAEIDLIIERPGEDTVLIEIKSSETIDERHVKHLIHFQKDFPDSIFMCACRVAKKQIMGNILVLPWKDALHTIGFSRY